MTRSRTLLFLFVLLAGEISMPCQAVLPEPAKPRAVPRPAPADPEAARAAETERKAREATLATIVIRPDAPCTLFVDGKQLAILTADVPYTFTAPGGEQYVDCVSTEFPTAKKTLVFTTKPRDKLTLSLSLADVLANARSQRAGEQRADAERRAAADTAMRRLAGMADAGTGVLRDTRSGLEWTAQDNGDDIDWPAAFAWCRQRGPGWRLPTVSELEFLYDRTGIANTRCGSTVCRVSTRLRLSEAFFWGTAPDGSGDAWSVGLRSGQRDTRVPDRSDGQRALCVRKP